MYEGQKTTSKGHFFSFYHVDSRDWMQNIRFNSKFSCQLYSLNEYKLWSVCSLFIDNLHLKVLLAYTISRYSDYITQIIWKLFLKQSLELEKTQQIRCFPCKQKNLSLIPRNYIKEQGLLRHACNPSPMEGETGRTLSIACSTA